MPSIFQELRCIKSLECPKTIDELLKFVPYIKNYSGSEAVDWYSIRATSELQLSNSPFMSHSGISKGTSHLQTVLLQKRKSFRCKILMKSMSQCSFIFFLYSYNLFLPLLATCCRFHGSLALLSLKLSPKGYTALDS